MSLFHPRPASRQRFFSTMPARGSVEWWAQQLVTFGGNAYAGLPLQTTYGKNPAESIADDFTGYVVGLLREAAPIAAVEGFRTRVLSEARFLYQRIQGGRPSDLFSSGELDLLETPWTGGTTGDLITRMMLHADFGGSAYVHRSPTEVVLLRPDWVDIVLTERMVEVGGVRKQVGWQRLGYAWWEGGKGSGSKPVIFMPDEIAQFSPLPDPLASWRGMSWLTPIIREVQADRQATIHKQAFLDNAATPNLAVSLKNAVTPKQFKAFVEAMDESHAGVENAGKTLYLGGGADVTVVGANMSEMDFSGIVGKGETRIANAAGIHPVVVGLSEGMQGSSLNAGNYNSAKKMTVDGTLRPLWRNLAGSLQILFPPPKPPPRQEYSAARLWIDTRDVAFLRDDAIDAANVQQTEASTIRILLDAGFTPDSVKAALAANDWSLLQHSGFYSVQLQSPGANQPAA